MNLVQLIESDWFLCDRRGVYENPGNGLLRDSATSEEATSDASRLSLGVNKLKTMQTTAQRTGITPIEICKAYALML